MFKIQGIHGSRSIYVAIRYLGDKNTPAHTTLTDNGRATPVSKGTPRAKKIGNHYYLPNQNGIYHRNLANWGINLTGDNIHSACKDADSIVRLKKHKLRGLQLIISPQKRLDIHDPDQIYRFQQFVTGVTKELYGNNYASYCALQCDNSELHSPRMHAHILTINTNMRNHRALKGKVYSVQHINKIIDHQIDLDNKRHPNDPIFTKHNIATNKLEALRTTLTDNDNTKLINKAVNTVLAPGYTVTNRQGKKRTIASNNMFKYAMKQQGVEPYFKRHKKYYHDRYGNRIPVTNHGKTERTKKGAIKYKYYLRHGLVYRIRSKNKHNVTLNASDVAKLYPNCSYNYIHDALHKNYVRYVNSHQHDRNARVQHDVKQMQKYRQHSAEYQRVHVYRPNDVRDVMPNLRNPIKHELYNDLNEIEPVMAVHKKQGQHLKRTQHLYMTQPNQMERGMIQHYRTNLFSRLHRKYDKIKKRTLMYKVKMVNSFKKEANKAGDWLQRHHLRNVGKWVKKIVQKKNQKKNKKKIIDLFSKQPITVSNQLANQTGNPYSKNVELAKRIERNNSRILNKPIVHENDITIKPIGIKDVFRGLHSNTAREAFYIHEHEIIPLIRTPKYKKLGLKTDSVILKNAGLTRHDINLMAGYYKTFKKRIAKKISQINDPVFKHYSIHQQSDLVAQNLIQSDLKQVQPEIKKFSARDANDFIAYNNNLRFSDYVDLAVNESNATSHTHNQLLIDGKPALKVYKKDKTAYDLKQMREEIAKNREEREHSQERQRNNHPHFNDDGPTLG